MMKKTIRLKEGDLHRVIKESVKRILNEVSADLADRAARKAYMKAREGFGKYGNGNEIPWNSPHGKKFQQGEKFLRYRDEKLGGNEGYWIYYPNGDDSTMVLKDAEGNVVTKLCHSIAELEAEFNKLCDDSKY